jgi:hypothetical protein
VLTRGQEQTARQQTASKQQRRHVTVVESKFLQLEESEVFALELISIWIWIWIGIEDIYSISGLIWSQPHNHKRTSHTPHK